MDLEVLRSGPPILGTPSRSGDPLQIWGPPPDMGRGPHMGWVPHVVWVHMETSLKGPYDTNGPLKG